MRSIIRMDIDLRKAWNDPSELRPYDVTLEIDEQAIAQELAHKAAKSKSRTSKFMRGKVIVKVTPVPSGL